MEIITKHNRKIALCLMALFLSLKVLGLHVLSHSCDDDKDLNCVVCDVVISEGVKPLLAPQETNYTFEITVFSIEKQLPIASVINIIKAIETNQLFSRPPPIV
ncbi:hypothetical protein FUA26_07660 [Seonamhaeicola algicola]|uniref:Uncharacterized protein n=1 Tax=Seonamhaeicola algicola TaxID=1719036 RepID=A0A5C7B262_9FLAO|nr:hypothetical protein [Seonamhaeicola algicola]TXE11932.1 hypothetical protein FUA26_07660 [Seonamhaeicola algicola]